MAKQAKRSTGFTVAVFPTGTRVSAKRRRKSLAPELRQGEGRKPPLRADGVPRELRPAKENPRGRQP